MKINRLLEITILLLNGKSLTAAELAERFEVSTRTIYRDIDVLSAAGVPVYTNKGKGGGISLLEDYSLNKAILSEKERESLLFALKTMGATRYPDGERVLEKLSSVFKNDNADDWIAIDFAGWGSLPNEKNKLSAVREAIAGKQVIEFDYINAQGLRSTRKIEPEKLYFNVNTWYLIGYCLLRNSRRIFRFSRIKNVRLCDEKFTLREQDEAEKHRIEIFNKPFIKLRLLFHPDALYRLYDEFEESFITKLDSGFYEVNASMPYDEWVYGFLLSFGEKVTVLEPEEVRAEIVKRMRESLENYEKLLEYDIQLSSNAGMMGSSNELEEKQMKIEKYSQPEQPVVYLRIITSLEKMTEAFAEGYGKLAAYLGEQGKTPVGPPYAAYYNEDMQKIDLEMGMPVAELLPEKGELKSRMLPQIDDAISVVYKGSYKGLEQAYHMTYQYVGENGLVPTYPMYDIYVSDPAKTAESELLTRVVVPVMK